MGTVFKKTYTKPLPEGVERFTRKGVEHARWTGKGGRKWVGRVTAGKDGTARVLLETKTYTARYRDGVGIVHEVATGCRDRGAALSVLHELETRAEKVRSGVLSVAESEAADWQRAGMARHLEAYGEHLKAREVTPRHGKERHAELCRLFEECGFKRLCDLDRLTLERWLNARKEEGMSARRRNVFQTGIVAFCNWGMQAKRLMANPFAGMPKANEKADRRRTRRALTEDELGRLLSAARRRPLHQCEHAQGTAKKARLSEEQRQRLERTGLGRSLVYKLLVLTGLRKSELASVTVGNVHVRGSMPHIVLEARSEKSRRGAQIALRADVAADIDVWLGLRLEWLRAECLASGEPVPARLPVTMPLFDVPVNLSRVLDKDLAFAQIPKRDSTGRTIDVHSFRHSFCSHLMRAGTNLRTAQAAMRHANSALTSTVYTDVELLDVAGALDGLPGLPWGGNETAETGQMAAAGEPSLLAPLLALPPGVSSPNVSFRGNKAAHQVDGAIENGGATIANSGGGFRTMARDSRGKKEWRPVGDLNPCRRRERPVSWTRLDERDAELT